jgi:hypothetical protein
LVTLIALDSHLVDRRSTVHVPGTTIVRQHDILIGSRTHAEGRPFPNINGEWVGQQSFSPALATSPWPSPRAP